MNAHVLLNLSIKSGKSDKKRCLSNILSLFGMSLIYLIIYEYKLLDSNII